MTTPTREAETWGKYKAERDFLEALHLKCNDEGFGCEYEDYFVDGQRYTRCKLLRENWDKLQVLLTKHTEKAIKIHDLENHIEMLDVQCSEGTGCTNCDSKRPTLKKLQAELATLKTQLETL